MTFFASPEAGTLHRSNPRLLLHLCCAPCSTHVVQVLKEQFEVTGHFYNPNIHPGLDIAGPEGNSVFATDSGVVVYAGWSEYGYGYLIVLDHGTGWQSAYAHLSAVGVGCGQSVAQGTVIGAVGNTGNSTGAHLHFELRS